MNNTIGKRIWIFPDGELPPEGRFDLKGHESIIILNTSSQQAQVNMTLYFTDQNPWDDIEINVDPERVRCIRMDNPNDVAGKAIPRETQYSISLRSNVPVVVQYGRLDTREQPMAFYTNTGYCE